MEYNQEKINGIVEELLASLQTDAEMLASRITTEIAGDFSPYSDGDDMLDEDADTIQEAEDFLRRFNS